MRGQDHSLRRGGVRGQGLVDDVAVEPDVALANGEILLSNRAAFELQRDTPMGLVGLGDEQDAGGILVQAVHDARAKGVVAAA